jgi:hypothetical protein
MERMWKKVVAAYFKLLYQYLLGRTDEKPEQLGQVNGAPGRNSNLGPSYYEADMLTTHP